MFSFISRTVKMRTIKQSRAKVCRWLYICTCSCLFSINVDLVLLPLASVESSNVFQRAQPYWTTLKLFLLPHMQSHSECIGFLSRHLYLCLFFLGAQIPVIQGCFFFFFRLNAVLLHQVSSQYLFSRVFSQALTHRGMCLFDVCVHCKSISTIIQ